MKKYIKPNNKVVEIDLESLIAESPGVHDEVSDSENFVKEERGNLGNDRQNLWDKEW